MVGAGKNSTGKKRVRQQFLVSSCWAETVYSQTVSLPPPHSSKGSGNLWRLEMKRTLFASVVEVRFGVWNTNCWDLLRKPYLQPLTVHWTVKPNQPLRWDIDTNSEKRCGAFCPASKFVLCLTHNRLAQSVKICLILIVIKCYYF